ncbi:MAG: FAD-binding oxidoreductase [Polyangiales bacterium]
MTERARSFWGWGFADRFPDDDTRRALAAQVGTMLGLDGLAPLEAPSLASIALAAPRVAAPPPLAPFVGGARGERIHHARGKSFRDLVLGFSGDFSSAPDLVARPRDEADVVALLGWASSAHVAVVPFGGGTSVCDGVDGGLGGRSSRFAGVVSLDLGALDRVLAIDDTSRAARIQAGAKGPAIEAQLAAHGLTLRHYPQSFEFSTLGGWIATRAGGHFATLYTHIDDLVESVRMITPSGPWESRRLPASGAGPAPDRLVLGSEGILGVITEAWMRVQRRPRFRASASVHFASAPDPDGWTRAVDATRAIAQSGLYPSNCRLLDAAEAALHFVTGPGNEEGSHVLLLGFESADHPCDAAIERAAAIAVEHGGRIPRGIVRKDEGSKVSDAGAATAWRAAFFEAPYHQSVLVSLGAVVDTFETACTWDRFPALHAAVFEATLEAMRRVCGAGRISCRFTHVYPDGPAPYYTFLAPGGPRAIDRLAQWEVIKSAASDALIANGATITHHHAVGRMHRPWYDRERPEPFARALLAAKAALDPAGVLNPGVLVDAG